MGGGGKKSQKIPVRDYAISMHYAMCSGPIDSLNQLVIKEKEVFCGRMTAAGVMPINQPELFGGDDGEGGPVGDLEVYFGDYAQLMSDEMSSRVGLTPTTMPGYRGIANLFFRGAEGSGRGFKWTTNNPYLPGAYVNVTRISNTLGGGFCEVYPGFGDELTTLEQALPVGAQTTSNPVAVDVSAYADAIDAGLFTFSAALSGTANFDGSLVSGPATLQTRVGLLLQDGSGANVPVTPPVTDWSDIETGTGSASASISVLIPPGVRTLIVDAFYNTTTPSLTIIEILSATMSFEYPLRGEPLCEGQDALPDMNPSCIIYDICRDTQWGRGMPAAAIDTASFAYAAQVLFDENFGLSFFWNRQSDMESVIAEVLDHIQGALFASPVTGLLTLKLFRDDYDVNTLPLLDETNSKVTKFQTKSPSELVNEVTILWTNPVTEQEESVTFQDPASIAVQNGQVVPESRNYYMVRNRQLANRVGSRDIIAATANLASISIQADRSFWRTQPGDVVRVKSVDDGVEQMVCRVMKVDRGKKGKMPVNLQLLEDVFGLEAADYNPIQRTSWEPVSEVPEPLEKVEIQTAPRFVMSLLGVDATPENEPDTVSMVLARRNGSGVTGFRLIGPTTLVNGDTGTGSRGVKDTTPNGVLSEAWDQETQTIKTEPLAAGFIGDFGPQVAGLALIGSGEATSEIVMFDSYNDATDEWTIARGMLDTVPQEWPAGADIWFIREGVSTVDVNETAYGEVLDYKLLTKTASAELSEASVNPVSYTAIDRPYLPTRPANVVVDGVPWGDVGPLNPGDDLIVSWSTRNRFLEDAVLFRWDEGNVTPEAGQTTVIIVRSKLTDTVLGEITGLGGDTHTFNPAPLANGEREIYLDFYAERDGMRSLQAVSRLVELDFTGYGYTYGQNYGT